MISFKKEYFRWFHRTRKTKFWRRTSGSTTSGRTRCWLGTLQSSTTSLNSGWAPSFGFNNDQSRKYEACCLFPNRRIYQNLVTASERLDDGKMLAYAKNMFALELLLLIYWAAFVSGDNYYTQKLDTFWPQNRTFLIEKFKHFTGEGL